MTISNRSIAVSGVIATIVAAILGAYVTDHLSKADPAVFVTSIGFGGPSGEQSVEATDSIVSLSSQVDDFPSIKKFESYRFLYDYDINISEERQSLEKGAKDIESWKKSFSSLPMTGQILEDCPILSNKTVANVAVGVLRHVKLLDFPTSLQDINKKEAGEQGFFKYGQVGGGEDGKSGGKWVVYLSRGNISINVPNIKLDYIQKSAEIYVKTIAYGDIKNINYLLDLSSSKINQKLLMLQDLQKKLRDLLLPNSTLTAKLYFYNNGSRASTLRPYFGLRILHPNFKNKIFILTPDVTKVQPSSDQSPFELTSGGFNISGPKKREGKDVEAVPFLPAGAASEYIQLAPNEAKSAQSSTIFKLGDSAEDLVRILQTGLLDFQVVAVTASGQKIWSEKAPFSIKVSSEQIDEMKKLFTE